MEDTNKKVEDSQETTIVGPVNDENVLLREGRLFLLELATTTLWRGLTRSLPALRQRYWNFRLNFF